MDIQLKATWTPRTEPNVTEYRVYRTDGDGPVLIETVPHPISTVSFEVVVPDGSTEALRFIVAAVFEGGYQGPNSAEAVIPLQLPELSPKNFVVQGVGSE